MRTVSFYSFKGGVGRTLALVNVAFALASRKKKVVLIDFDLEAPGITGFEDFRDLSGKPGVVEYVTDYLSKNAAPDVREFVHETSNQFIHLMPSGRQDGTYSSRLGGVDWFSLYAQRDGYLFFEDMKNQLESLNPDYLLIDSRTGHSDIGGICTRHLPDAVVCIFFPNRQNITGMVSATEAVRQERKITGKYIDLVFVPSRVPLLDDELGILDSKLKEASSALGYEECEVIVHHYDSMSLLGDAIFVKEKVNSRLAKEYNSLADIIIRGNISDRDGAIAYLTDTRKKLAKSVRNIDIDDIEQRLDQIAARHANDVEVTVGIADVKYEMVDYHGAYASLLPLAFSSAADSKINRRLAVLAGSLGRHDDARTYLTAILEDSAAEFGDYVMAIRQIHETDGGVEGVISIANLERFNSKQILMIATELQRSSSALPFVRECLELAISRGSCDEEILDGKLQLSLCLIADGKFIDAVKVTSSPADVTDKISWYYNYAIATWGAERSPPIDIFSRVINKDKPGQKREIANYNFCMAIAYAVCGDINSARNRAEAARAAIDRNPRLTFSPWTYLNVVPRDFRTHIDSLNKFISGELDAPDVLVSHWRS